MSRTLRSLGCMIGVFAVSVVRAAHGEYCTLESIPQTLDGLRSFDINGNCTRVASEGRVGPFAIGSAKEAVLAMLEKSEVSELTLLPRAEEPLRGFDRRALEVFSDAPGVRVWARGVPMALEIEFLGNRVALRNPSLEAYPAELQRLASSLQPKTTPTQVFDLLAAEPAQSRLTVAAVVPGGDWVPIPFSGPASRQLALKQSKWRFDGFEASCPFKPFYSTFKLVFADDRLVRIEHFCFPHELL